MKIVRTIVILIFIVFSNLSASNKWQMVDSIDFKFGKIIDLKCCDSMNCMYLVDKDLLGGFHIQRTTDGGETWKKVYMDSAYFKGADDYHLVPKIHSLSYPNEKLCIAVGDSGLVLRSTDKGETWDVFRTDTSRNNTTIKMYDNNNGILFSTKIGEFLNNNMYKTTNGGKSWILTDWQINNNKITIKSSQINYISLNVFAGLSLYQNKNGDFFRYLIYVHNNWESWDTVRAPLYTTYLTFGDKNNVWTAGNHDELDSAGWSRYRQYIYHSSDGGHSWVTQWDTVYNIWPLYDISFYDKNFGMASGVNGLILKTENGGSNWTPEYVTGTKPGKDKIVKNIQIPGSYNAFVVYGYQYIYKWTRPTTSAAEQSQSPEVILTPNPAGDYVDITLTGNRTLKDAVRVYDVLGVCVLTHPLAPSREGERVRLDVSGLAAGVYFVRVGGKMYKFVKM